MTDHEIKLLLIAQTLTFYINQIMASYESLCATASAIPSPQLQALVEHLSGGVALAINDRPDLQQFLNELGDIQSNLSNE